MFKNRFKLIAIAVLLCGAVMPLQAELNDPTRPPSVGKVTASSGSTKRAKGPRWVLSSTLVSPQRRSAVINDRVVAKGDKVDGALVLAIEPNKVRLRARGRELTLVMLNTDLKRPARP